MIDPPTNEVTFLLVVDTEKYAGNFERPMCAYMTAQVGECGCGDSEAEVAREDLPAEVLEWCSRHVRHRPDEHGCRRPVTIRPTPGWFNNGLGGEFRDDGKHEEEAKEHHAAECRKHAEGAIKTYGERNPDYAKDQEKHWLGMAAAPLNKFPAYKSIEITLDEKPSPKLFQLLQVRAMAYGQANDITVTAVKLIERTVTVTERQITE